jgi:hypothetical protein
LGSVLGVYFGGIACIIPTIRFILARIEEKMKEFITWVLVVMLIMVVGGFILGSITADHHCKVFGFSGYDTIMDSCSLNCGSRPGITITVSVPWKDIAAGAKPSDFCK